MFIPVGDDNRDRKSTPIVNYFFILLNIVVFVFLQDWGRNLHFSFAYATVPAEILSSNDVVTRSEILLDPLTGNRFEMPGLQMTPVPVYLTLLTSMFMHGGTAHLFGNMLYLWVFGDNIEDQMGHGRYFVFYLLCGILASLSHVFVSDYLGQSLLVPSLGASGAISGVLGAYILSFPTRAVHVWMLWMIISVPAIIAVGLWFVFQVINGMGILGGEEAAGGVAYAAHIGGFVAGFLLIKLFRSSKPVRRTSRQKEKSFW